MGPGTSAMRDILWCLDSSLIDLTQIRIFGHFSKGNAAPPIEKPINSRLNQIPR